MRVFHSDFSFHEAHWLFHDPHFLILVETDLALVLHDIYGVFA
jgi:hypothetical protein